MYFDPRDEWLARELKKLIGHGANPRSVLIYPTLRDLVIARNPQYADDPPVLARTIIKTLQAAVKLLSEPEAEACNSLLTLTRRAAAAGTYGRATAEVRRQYAIMVLGLYMSVETWRRPEGPELELMRKLAEAILQTLGGESAVA